jgi:formylglycine-generating enzyme required for sulfatase activity
MLRQLALLILAVFAGSVACQPKDPKGESPNEPKASEKGVPPNEPKGGEEREFEIAAGVKMKFCWIPAGKATLGSPQDEIARVSNEQEHDYETKGFWMGKYPVTQREWKAVIGTNPSSFQPGGYNKKELQKEGIQDSSQFPVEEVSWDTICKEGGFLEKMNKREGVTKVFGRAGKFVLPHENEWEYACRGGNGNKQPFYWGTELNGTQANCVGTEPYGTATKGPYLQRPTPVGSYAEKFPHPWGLCDMHGNVWQLCENSFEQDKKNICVLRGGGWYHSARDCRAAYRYTFLRDLGRNTHGFRLCYRLD